MTGGWNRDLDTDLKSIHDWGADIVISLMERFEYAEIHVDALPERFEIANSKKVIGRQDLIDQFQAQPGFGVIILSTVAVGFGVNVQAANHEIHFTLSWNPAKEDQATDRAYRIGQTKDVIVYYPTVIADDLKTFEQTLD